MTKGIVYEKSTGKVLYKFDTSTLPTLKEDESLKDRDDINEILVGAIYDPKTDTYVNPVIPSMKAKTVDEHKSEYANCKTDSERIAKIAEFLNLK